MSLAAQPQGMWDHGVDGRRSVWPVDGRRSVTLLEGIVP